MRECLNQIHLIRCLSFFCLICVAITTVPSVGLAFDWRTADRSSSGLAPSTSEEPRAVVQMYAARVVRWRKYFAVHSWIATKERNADHWLTYHVIGWRLRRGMSTVVIEKTQVPDGKWFGNQPALLLDLRGAEAESAIPKINSAALAYPHPFEYRAWPGPNSNTFISYLIRQTPEIKIELPPHAIGRDWLESRRMAGLSESKTGVQVSILGILGATVGIEEGFEVNIFGLTFGIDVLRPALKLPLVGRIGMKDSSWTHSASPKEAESELNPNSISESQ